MTTMQTRQPSNCGARIATILAATAVIGLLGMPGRAEPTNYWTNSFGGDWNAAGNWTNTAGDHAVPGITNFAVLPTNSGSGYTVDYTAPMSAASIQKLQMDSPGGGVTNVLNINAAGFVVNSNSANGGYGGDYPVLIQGRDEINVNSGGVLTVTNFGQPFWISAGTLNINGGTVNLLSLTSQWGYLGVDAAGVLNMNSGTLTATYIGIYVRWGSINFRGGVINTTRIALGGHISGDATMTMTNGTLIASTVYVGGNGGGLSGWRGHGTMTVSGGSVTNSGSLYISLGGSNGTLNVSGGSWVQTDADFLIGAWSGTGTGTVNISGTALFDSRGVVVGYDVGAETYCALNISNGVFQATNGTATALLNVKQGALTLSGGTVRADKLILQDNALTNTLKFVATPGSTNMGVVNVGGALTISNAATARLVVDMSQYTEWRTGVTSVLLVTYGTLATPFSSGNITVTPPPMPPMRITATVDQTGNRIQVNLKVPKGTVVSGR